MRVFCGNLDGAVALLDEADAIAEATGTPTILFARPMLPACRGDEAQASALIEASDSTATARGEGVTLTLANSRARCSITASVTIRRRWARPRARARGTS